MKICFIVLDEVQFVEFWFYKGLQIFWNVNLTILKHLRIRIIYEMQRLISIILLNNHRFRYRRISSLNRRQFELLRRHVFLDRSTLRNKHRLCLHIHCTIQPGVISPRSGYLVLDHSRGWNSVF